MNMQGGARITVRSLGRLYPSGLAAAVSRGLSCKLDAPYESKSIWYTNCPRLIAREGRGVAGTLDLAPLFQAVKALGYSEVAITVHLPALDMITVASPPWKQWRSKGDFHHVYLGTDLPALPPPPIRIGYEIGRGDVESAVFSMFLPALLPIAVIVALRKQFQRVLPAFGVIVAVLWYFAARYYGALTLLANFDDTSAFRTALWMTVVLVLPPLLIHLFASRSLEAVVQLSLFVVPAGLAIAGLDALTTQPRVSAGAWLLALLFWVAVTHSSPRPLFLLLGLLVSHLIGLYIYRPEHLEDSAMLLALAAIPVCFGIVLVVNRLLRPWKGTDHLVSDGVKYFVAGACFSYLFGEPMILVPGSIAIALELLTQVFIPSRAAVYTAH